MLMQNKLFLFLVFMIFSVLTNAQIKTFDSLLRVYHNDVRELIDFDSLYKKSDFFAVAIEPRNKMILGSATNVVINSLEEKVCFDEEKIRYTVRFSMLYKDSIDEFCLPLTKLENRIIEKKELKNVTLSIFIFYKRETYFLRIGEGIELTAEEEVIWEVFLDTL